MNWLQSTATGFLKLGTTVDYTIETYFSSGLIAGRDFEDADGGLEGTLTFAPGELSKTITVYVAPNAPVRHNSIITVGISNGVGATMPPIWLRWAEGRLSAE